MYKMNMQIILRERLWRYIINYRPDLMISLQTRQGISSFLREKVDAIVSTVMSMTAMGTSEFLIEEFCFNEITRELRPSRYKYIENNIKKHFSDEFRRYTETGMLLQEIIRLIEYTEEVFELFSISEDHIEDPAFEAALSHLIRDYFERK